MRLPYGVQPGTCPVQVLKAWMKAAGITRGPLFRPVPAFGPIPERPVCAKSVSLVVKRAAQRAGLDPDLYGGHSLRAGLATEAARAGVPERVIMQQTGHRSERVLRGYIREGSLFRENAAAAVGL